MPIDMDTIRKLSLSPQGPISLNDTNVRLFADKSSGQISLNDMNTQKQFFYITPGGGGYSTYGWNAGAHTGVGWFGSTEPNPVTLPSGAVLTGVLRQGSGSIEQGSGVVGASNIPNGKRVLISRLDWKNIRPYQAYATSSSTWEVPVLIGWQEGGKILFSAETV